MTFVWVSAFLYLLVRECAEGYLNASFVFCWIHRVNYYLFYSSWVLLLEGKIKIELVHQQHKPLTLLITALTR